MQALIDYTNNSDNELSYSQGGFWTSDEQNASNAVAFVEGSNWTLEQGTVSKGQPLNYVMVRRF